MTRPAPMHWHDQIADRTREVYAPETARARIEPDDEHEDDGRGDYPGISARDALGEIPGGDE